MSAEPTLLVAGRLGATEAVAGSAEGPPCADCGAATLIAPAGQRFLRDEPGAVVVCLPCAVERTRGDPDVEVRLVPGAAAEFYGHKRRN